MDQSDPLHEDHSLVQGCDTLVVKNPPTQAPLGPEERWRMEEALRESEERFRTIADGLPLIVWFHDAKGEQRFVNQTFLEFFGVTPEDIQGQRWQKLLHPEQARAYIDEFLACLRERRLFHAQVQVRRRDGQWAWIESWGRPRLSDSGKYLGFVGSSVDITERLRAEAALLESKERYQTLFDSIDEGFCIIEVHLDAADNAVDFHFLETNPAFEKHTGLHAVAGKSMRKLVPDLEDHWFETYGRIALTGQSERFEKKTRCFGNRWYELYAFRIGKPEERKVAMLFSDISQRKRTEESLLQLNATLEQRVAERTHLAEARTRQLQALAVELIEAEERERRKISELLHDDLQQVLAAARLHLDSVCQDLPHAELIKEVEKMLSYAISKSRSLSHQLSPAILNHSGLVDALKWLCRQMSEQFELKVELVTDEAAPLERMHLKVLVFRAVQELLFNVIKHAGVKNAQVILSASQNHAVVTVIDQGSGFDPGVLDSIPERAGLGLLSLRERLSYIGGHIRITSTHGQGSRFDLSIPMDLQTPELLREAEEYKPGEQVHELPSTSTVARRRVLLVDDHKVMRDGLKHLMQGQADIEVVGEAANGQEALELAHRLRPDVVIMDISMPLMDGIEATRRIKAELSDVRVIGLSMFEDELAGHSMRCAGADGFVTKTASSSELLKAVYDIALKGKQALKTLASSNPLVDRKISLNSTM